MVLKHDCIREVLLHIEKNLGYNDVLNAATIKCDYSIEDILYTCDKLSEAGYIEVSTNVLGVCLIRGITYSGHQFLDNIRDNKVWSKTKSILSKVESASIDIISKTAAQVIIQMLGPISVN